MSDLPVSESSKRPVVLERVTPENLPKYAYRLGAILSAHMLSGVSSNFIHPFTVEQATELFERNVQALKMGSDPGGIIMWIARLPKTEEPFESVDMDGKPTGCDDIIGGVQLAFHVAPNGRFRSEVRKLLVDERYQRRGVARTLMLELEKTARENGSTLCLLDTHQGGSGEKLYKSLGWQVAGYIPNFAHEPDGVTKNGAAYMYKEL